MEQRSSEEPEVDPAWREPINRPWLWVGLVLIVLVGVPFYLSAGSLYPLVGGIPYWLWISVVAAVAFAALICWACLRTWDLVEDAEERGSGNEVAS